ARKARNTASWATSSASVRLRSSQRARLKAASRCGKTMASNRALSSPSNTFAFLLPFYWITLPATILFPQRRLKVKKEILRECRPPGNKRRLGRVYLHEHVHTRRGFDPLSLQARAILPAGGQNVKGIAARNRDSRGEKR